MKLTDKIYIAGHNGLVGSAIFRLLKKKGYTNIITRSSAQLDLRDQKTVNDFFEAEQPAYVFMAAAKVGGIMANQTY
ncbi:MAG: NAD-dependent epimerase/dehydratase family protein, partial [Bacteroidota bacterium]